MSNPLSESPYRHALWTAGPTFDLVDAISEGVSVADYRSFAFIVAVNVQGETSSGTFYYYLQTKLPGGLPDPGAASTPGTTTTGDIWVTVQEGTHDLNDGALVIRDVNSPYRELRLVGVFGVPPSYQVNAWLLLKKD